MKIKHFIRWVSGLGLLALVITCVEIDINRPKTSTVTEGEINILNLVTIGILVIVVARIIKGIN